MTYLIGLAGPAGAGKDSIADVLVEEYGWRKFSFSDELYREVAAAFRVPLDLLYDRETKEHPWSALHLSACSDPAFVQVACAVLRQAGEYDGHRSLLEPRTPRWILQRWGTDYRRAQDPVYWIKRADDAFWAGVEEGIPGMANTSVRFPNELEWLRQRKGQVVHVERPGHAPESDYVSERPLPRGNRDYVIRNDANLSNLRARVRLFHDDFLVRRHA